MENWYCEVLFTELGPLSWDQLREWASRGTLRPKDRVRQASGGWRVAADVEGLFIAPSATDSTDFEVDAATPPKPADDDFDFDVSTP
ncbi:MAG TPA: DUF4339 domain-containing protein [Pirellulales bacterium]|nr:DUF4339 domain-containing protein [Pirellulales bacterium]